MSKRAAALSFASKREFTAALQRRPTPPTKHLDDEFAGPDKVWMAEWDQVQKHRRGEGTLTVGSLFNASSSYAKLQKLGLGHQRGIVERSRGPVQTFGSHRAWSWRWSC